MFLMTMPIVQLAYASCDAPGGSAYENSEYASPRRRNRNAYISHVVGTGETVYSVLVDIAGELRKEGIIALPIRRPTVPPGGERIRFSLGADMDFDSFLPVFKILENQRYEM